MWLLVLGTSACRVVGGSEDNDAGNVAGADSRGAATSGGSSGGGRQVAGAGMTGRMDLPGGSAGAPVGPVGGTSGVSNGGASHGGSSQLQAGGTAGAAGAGSSQCSDLDVTGVPAVTPTAVAEVPPTALGGAPHAGTYVLTSITQYTGPGGGTTPAGVWSSAYLLRLSGGSGTVTGFEAALTLGTSVHQMAGQISFYGASYSTTVTCGTGSGTTGGYTATETTMALVDDSEAMPVWFEFEWIQ